MTEIRNFAGQWMIAAQHGVEVDETLGTVVYLDGLGYGRTSKKVDVQLEQGDDPNRVEAIFTREHPPLTGIGTLLVDDITLPQAISGRVVVVEGDHTARTLDVVFEHPEKQPPQIWWAGGNVDS